MGVGRLVTGGEEVPAQSAKCPSSSEQHRSALNGPVRSLPLCATERYLCYYSIRKGRRGWMVVEEVFPSFFSSFSNPSLQREPLLNKARDEKRPVLSRGAAQHTNRMCISLKKISVGRKIRLVFKLCGLILPSLPSMPLQHL